MLSLAIPPISRKAMVVGFLLFAFTMAWGFFFSTLELTPMNLLSTTGSLGAFNKIITLNFFVFALFFALCLATIATYANKDLKQVAILISLIPSVVAFAILALAFPIFAQWAPMAIFYLATIPVVVITAHVKQQEMKILPVLRSNFSVSHRTMQILGLGVIVTLAFYALPQQDKLYTQFEQSLFSGDLIKSLNVESASADFLIKSQKDTLQRLSDSTEYQAIFNSPDTQDQQFVQLMQTSLQRVDSPAYRSEVEEEVRTQKRSLKTDDVIAQLKTKLPQFQLLQQNYWIIASFLGAIIFFVAATFIIQPLTALLGVAMDKFIPGEAEPLMVEEPPAQPPYGGVMETTTETPTIPTSSSFSPPMGSPEVPRQNGNM